MEVAATGPIPRDVFYLYERRLRELSGALMLADRKLVPLQYKYRKHTEFEREGEWLHYARKVYLIFAYF